MVSTNEVVNESEKHTTKKSLVIDLTIPSEDIEKCFVSEKTASIYKGILVRFIVWLFDNHKHHIEASIMDDLMDCHERDKLEELNPSIPEPRSKKKKSTNKKRKKSNGNEESLRKHLRLACKTHLANMKPSMNGCAHYSPVVIQGENELTYETIREFMMERKKSAVINEETVKAFLKQVKKNSYSDFYGEEYVNDGKVEVTVQQSMSSYESVRSSIGYIYKMCRIPMPKEMRDNLKMLIAGKRRAGLKEKEGLGLSIVEGKRPLSQEAYELLAKTLFFSEKKEHIFAHVFLVLDWTLMKRAENCVNCKINHISFCNDCLVFEFAKSKSHQTGEKHVGPWHVYANPHKPWCCPVLCLARYIFAYPEVLKGDMPLFDGTSQYQRYHKLFSKLVKSLEPELFDLGFFPGDLGAHSCRKGVATLIASGSTVCPPISSLCIRAGWVMGGMKDKYIFREKAGDQYVGRCASLLDQLSKEFAVSPPYFDFESLSDREKIEKRNEINEFLRFTLPNAKKILPQTWNMVLFCFASLCYHYNYLCRNLHKECILRGSPVFQNISEKLMNFAKIAYPWTSTKDTPTLTGIPPHVTLMSEFQRVTQEVEEFKSSLPNTISSMLDGRGFSSTGMNTDKVIIFFKKASEDMVSQILEKTNASSLKDTNEDGFNSGVSYVLDEEEITTSTPYKNLRNLTKTEKNLKASKEHANSVACVKRRRLKVGYHHGKLTILPPDFAFPRMTTHQLVLNWLVGNLKKNLPPYSALSATDVSHDKRLHKPYHEMKILMRYIECVARRQNCWVHNNKDCTNENVNNMWEEIGNRFIIDPFAKKKSGRRKETSWKTVYNRLALAKEFSRKGRTIYTNNPKEIVPIVECPSSPPGIKDPPQIATTHDDKEMSPSASPPGIKDPPQIATIEQNKQNQFYNTFIEDHKVIQLKRNAAGMFEVTKCETCPATTQHRCQYPVLDGKCFDVDMGIRICGRAICNLCLGESSMRRCRYHRFI